MFQMLGGSHPGAYRARPFGRPVARRESVTGSSGSTARRLPSGAEHQVVERRRRPSVRTVTSCRPAGRPSAITRGRRSSSTNATTASPCVRSAVSLTRHHEFSGTTIVSSAAPRTRSRTLAGLRIAIYLTPGDAERRPQPRVRVTEARRRRSVAHPQDLTCGAPRSVTSESERADNRPRRSHEHLSADAVEHDVPTSNGPLSPMSGPNRSSPERGDAHRLVLVRHPPSRSGRRGELTRRSRGIRPPGRRSCSSANVDILRRAASGRRVNHVTLRVVHCGTGNVGLAGLELVGQYVWSRRMASTRARCGCPMACAPPTTGTLLAVEPDCLSNFGDSIGQSSTPPDVCAGSEHG